ncbi:uncharacterized protein LOC107366578 [Tetranychus urticae]|uniref:Uncharacterized protein n=1 Tax=Tetranychus urticae TaxID=32264 RepID=T1KQU7_TETUR|nr:uncharacterized protein LOC107366578 [Tetranychus urticae]
MGFKFSTFIVTLLGLISFSCAIFFPSLQKTQQLCVNSDQPNIKNTCVICDSRRFVDMSRQCTGQDKVPDITTQDQALCLISNCLQQIPKQQRKIVLGRKRRSIINTSVALL